MQNSECLRTGNAEVCYTGVKYENLMRFWSWRQNHDFYDFVIKTDFWQQIFLAAKYDIIHDIFSMPHDQKNMSFKTQTHNNKIYPFLKVWNVEMSLFGRDDKQQNSVIKWNEAAFVSQTTPDMHYMITVRI